MFSIFLRCNCKHCRLKKKNSPACLFGRRFGLGGLEGAEGQDKEGRAEDHGAPLEGRGIEVRLGKEIISVHFEKKHI